MSHPAARHPHHQTTYLPTRPPFSESPLCGLINQLIECRIHIVSKLYLGYGSHTLRRAADGEPHDALFGQGRVEDAFRAKGCRQVAGTPKHTAKCDILAEDECSRGGLEGMREGSVDGLEEVEAGGGAISGELRAGCIQGGGRLMEKGV